MTRRAGLPATIVVGVVVAFFGTAAYSLASHLVLNSSSDDFGSRSFESLYRWSAFHHGSAIAAMLLIAGGLFVIAGRLSRWQRTLVLVTAWLHLGGLGWMLARPVVFQVFSGSESFELLTWVWRGVAIVMWAGAVALTIAARAWWRPHSPLLVVAAVVMVLCDAINWVPYIGEWIHSLRDDHKILYQFIWPIRGLLSDGALLVVAYALVREAPDPLPDRNAATAWFRGAEASILVRIVAAVGLSILGLGIVRSPSAVKAVLVGGPMIAIACSLVFAWAVLSIERAALPGMPTIRLVLGAGATAWAAGIQLLQTLAAYKMLSNDSFGSDHNEATLWSIGAPLVGITGVVLVCSAISKFALTRSDESLREMAVARGTIYGILTGVGILLPYVLEGAREKSTIIGVSLILALCAIAGLVLLAGLMRRAAESIGTTPTLPEARLR
jgi:hypothetical protein